VEDEVEGGDPTLTAGGKISWPGGCGVGSAGVRSFKGSAARTNEDAFIEEEDFLEGLCLRRDMRNKIKIKIKGDFFFFFFFFVGEDEEEVEETNRTETKIIKK
jgi:hypothetical protein